MTHMPIKLQNERIKHFGKELEIVVVIMQNLFL